MNEKIKNYLGVAGIVALLLGGTATWRYVDAYSRSIGPGSFRSFSVSGEGKVNAIPDIAQFTFTVITEGDANDEQSLAPIQQDNTNKVNKAIAFVKSKGVETKDIKTEDYNINPRYTSCSYRLGEICPSPSIDGYTITQTVGVKVRDLTRVGELLGGVVKNGANTVSGLTFTVDDPTTLENQARAEAIAKARTKAEATAKAGGFSLGKLLSVNDQSPVYPYYEQRTLGMGGGDAIKSAPVAPAIEPGSKEITVSVTLNYEIE